MKKIISLVILLSSLPAFSATNLTCGVFKGHAAGTPAQKMVIDLEKTRDFQSMFISATQTFSATTSDDILNIGFSEEDGVTNISLYKSMLLKMEKGESIAVKSLRVNDSEKTNTAVCYLTGESDQGPFDS